jgi:hypothetical protein
MASVELHQGDETLILPAKNLSLGGIYVGADGHDLSRYPIGTGMELLVFDVTDETRPSVRGAAEVVRHDEGGMAMRWSESGDTLGSIRELLKALRAGG